MTMLHALLSIGSGSLVGFTLGLIGGGGSILAVPLLVYVVGVRSPHVAIGTSALAVAASATVNLFGHARADTVKWRCALVFALSGVAGAAGGAQLGKMVDGSRLLMLFGVLMVVVGLAMLRPRKSGGNPNVMLTRESMPRLLPWLIGVGFLVGALSGFFGIGGGFLIVPGLMGATAMPADQRHRLLTRFGDRLRRHHRGKLCLVRPRRLALGHAVHRRWHVRRLRRYQARPPSRPLQARAHADVFRRGDRGRALCDREVAFHLMTPC
jgi:uncharacterized membrane protein YfcA